VTTQEVVQHQLVLARVGAQHPIEVHVHLAHRNLVPRGGEAAGDLESLEFSEDRPQLPRALPEQFESGLERM
jgi:hypothetical protein